MFLIAYHADFHMLYICFVSNRCESIMTPRFRASGFDGMVHPLMLMSGISFELKKSCCKVGNFSFIRFTREAVTSAPDHYVINAQLQLG